MDLDLGRRIRDCLIYTLDAHDVGSVEYLQLRSDENLARDFMRLDGWERIIHRREIPNWGHRSTKRFLAFVDHYKLRPPKKWKYPWERQ